MNINSVGKHVDFPNCVWAIIEQPPLEPNRIKYDSPTGTFIRTEYKSLAYERGFSGAYGWIAGTGLPPEPHFDVIVLTKRSVQPGDVIESLICGMFKRRDNDHKFVALDSELSLSVTEPDLGALHPDNYSELMRLYPDVNEQEAWLGGKEARSFLQHNIPTHD